MFVLNSEFYERWATCEQPVVRFWLRFWEDGLFSGTHPRWTFTPFNLSALADLWKLFEGRKVQRDAVKVLARLRAWMPDGENRTYPTDAATDEEWNRFFETVKDTQTEMRKYIFAKLRSLFEIDVIEPAIWDVMKVTSALSSQLLYEGVSDHELFLRTAGVLARCNGDVA